MKRNVTILLALVCAMIFGLNEMAFSDGAAFPGPCDKGKLPAPTSGPWITGYFTAARDMARPGESHYDIHAILRSPEPDGKIREFMFSLSTSALGGKTPGNICANSASDLVDQFKDKPCLLGVEKAFGLTGKPVLAEIFNIRTSDCGKNNEMMYGEMAIRIVPPIK